MTILAFPDTTGQPTDGSFTYEANGVIYSWTGEYWAANNSQGFDQRYVNADGDTMTGDLTVPNLTSQGDVQTTSLNGGPLAGFRNLLINGDYAIAQRFPDYPWTTTGVQNNSDPKTLFGPDRWGTPQFREFQSRNERPSNAYPGSFQWRTGTQANATWHQVIELLGNGSAGPRNNPLLETDNWTVSHWIFAADRNNFVCDIDYVNASYSPSISQAIASIADGDWETVETQGDWIRVAASFSMAGVADAPAGALGIRVQFRNDSNIRAVGAQLEPGPVATPVEHRPTGLERQLCERYYYKAPDGIWRLYQSGASRVQANLWFPTTMRTTPTCQLFNVQASSGVTSVTANDPTPRGFLAVCNPNNSTLPGTTEAYAGTYSGDAEL